MDLFTLSGVLRRRWLPLVLCLVAGIAGGLVVSKTTTKSYAASSRLFVNIPAARGVQEALQGVQLSVQLIDSYSKIATSRTVAERVAQRIGHGLTPGQVRSKIKASGPANTLLLDVGATDTDPARARDLANATATVLIGVISDLEHGKQDPVEARIIDSAVRSGRPISPRPKVDLTLGLLLGLAAGTLIALGLEAADHRQAASAAADGRAAPDGASSGPLTERVWALSDEVEGLAALIGSVNATLGTIDGRLVGIEQRLTPSAEPPPTAKAPARRSTTRTRRPVGDR